MAEQSQNLLNFGNKQENNGADSQGRLTAYEFNQVIDAINNNSNDVFDLHNKTKDLENVDNTKKNKDYVIQANIFNESLTLNGVEYPLVDVDWETLSNVILSNECDIVFVDSRGERYKLDHVWCAEGGLPFGYKFLNDNRRLNVSTVTDSDGNLRVVYKFNDGAVTYDDLGGKPSINGKELVGGENTAEDLDLCRKPIVLTFKLDESGNRIVLDEQATVKSYLVEGATYEELKQAYQLRRPLYFSIKQLYSSYSQLTAGLIPLTYRIGEIDGFEGEGFWAHGTDGLSGVEYNESTDMGVGYIGGYTIIGEPANENGEFVMHCSEGVVASSYETMVGLPQINGVTLKDNKTSKDLKLQGALSTSADLALRDDVLSLTDMAKKRLFIDLWNECAVDFGRYNEETGFFELNGLTDLTYEDAVFIYTISARKDAVFFANVGFGYGANTRPLKGRFRTNLPINYGEYPYNTADGAAKKISTYLCSELEVLNVFPKMPFGRTDFYTRSQCSGLDLYYNNKLRKVMGKIRLVKVNAIYYGYNFPYLEEINLYNITNDYKYFYKTPKLNYTSVKTMIEQRGGTNAITIWYHADVYNKILGTAADSAYEGSGGTKAEWMAIADLAASKNITLATE